ncbi:hypothetical protein HYS93_00290 [Candidatus Daviesbacteria bacterium]|nr:hypothetical protein [Candidatus Daviesbacteria bacterium]
MSVDTNPGLEVYSAFPRRDFYLENPDSKYLRGVVMAAASGVGILLQDPDVAEDAAEQDKIYAHLGKCGPALRNRGVIPNMYEDIIHSSLGFRFISTHPVRMAEYGAGLMLVLIEGGHIVSEADILDNLEGYKRLKVTTDDPSQVEVPDNVKTLTRQWATLEHVRLMLDFELEGYISPYGSATREGSSSTTQLVPNGQGTWPNSNPLSINPLSTL